MNHKTKVDRANRTAELLEQRIGHELPLRTWFYIINQQIRERFPSEYNYSNTKELARAFRYLHLKNKLRCIKKNKFTSMERVVTQNIVYVFERYVQ